MTDVVPRRATWLAADAGVDVRPIRGRVVRTDDDDDASKISQGAQLSQKDRAMLHAVVRLLKCNSRLQNDR